MISNSYINPKDHQMIEVFNLFKNLNFDAYEKVILVENHNAINPSDLSTPFSSEVKIHDHRIQLFEKLATLLNRFDLRDIAKSLSGKFQTSFSSA